MSDLTSSVSASALSLLGKISNIGESYYVRTHVLTCDASELTEFVTESKAGNEYLKVPFDGGVKAVFASSYGELLPSSGEIEILVREQVRDIPGNAKLNIKAKPLSSTEADNYSLVWQATEVDL